MLSHRKFDKSQSRILKMTKYIHINFIHPKSAKSYELTNCLYMNSNDNFLHLEFLAHRTAIYTTEFMPITTNQFRILSST